MTHLLADVVVPEVWDWRAPGQWYVLGALGAEAFIFCFIGFRAAPLWSLVLAVVTANVVSSVAGVFLALWVLPSLPSSPQTWGMFFSVFFFILAWALSVGIEYAVYLCVPPWRRLPHLLRAVVLSNLASYAIFFVVLKIL